MAARRAATRHLTNHEPELDSLLTVAAATLDSNGVLREANAGFLHLIAGTDAHPIGTIIARVFAQPAFDALLANARVPDGYLGLMTIGDPAGRTRTLRGRAHAILGGIRVLAEYDIAEIEGMTDTMLDLNREAAAARDALARTNVSLRQHQTELERLNQLKNTFLGMAAHDLRNPIGAINMTCQLLVDPSIALTPEETLDFIGDIRRQSEHMVALIEDLLDVSVIESGKLTLEPVPIDAGTLIADAVKRHSSFAVAKGSQVISTGSPTGTIHADPARLRQVIDNLISNAIKYSPPGSRVEVALVPEREGWRLTVRDQGPGLSEEDRAHLFEDFRKLSAKPTSGEKSTGLGLAISRRIVEAHGGAIGVESSDRSGATFWVTLPNPASAR